ncbi:MAG: hypothetical protein RJQ01_05785 [Microcella sp.]|uniref:hypothetical protein n=1 Tax=Microcella sp. TaxID=1913979 RepID=UPI003316495B
MTARVRKDSANWRIFGGGAMLAGSVAWLIALLIQAAGQGGEISTWLTIIGFLLLAASGFFLAFGQTGSNGVVGGSVLGKLGFVAFGVGFLLMAIVPLLAALGVALPGELVTVGAILLVVGGIVGAIVTYQKGVARGSARWFFAIPAVVALIWVATTLGWIAIGGNILVTILVIAYAVAGLLFLLNRR